MSRDEGTTVVQETMITPSPSGTGSLRSLIVRNRCGLGPRKVEILQGEIGTIIVPVAVDGGIYAPQMFLTDPILRVGSAL
jgi:hypothetical protein